MFGLLDDVLEVGAGIVTGTVGAKVGKETAKTFTNDKTIGTVAEIAGGIIGAKLGVDLVQSVSSLLNED